MIDVWGTTRVGGFIDWRQRLECALDAKKSTMGIIKLVGMWR